MGKLPSHRLFCFKEVSWQKQSSINLNTINTRILDICLFIKTEWKDIKERMKTMVKRSLVWLYKILNVRMTNQQQEARANLLNEGESFPLYCVKTTSKEYQISFLHRIYFNSTTNSRQLFRQNINSQHLSKNLNNVHKFWNKVGILLNLFLTLFSSRSNKN